MQNAPMLSLRNIAVALLVAVAITTVIDLPTSAQDSSAAVATNINVVGGDQQIIVTWDPPNDPENRQVLVYLVQWREKSNTSNSGSKTINGDAPRTYTITDLNGVDLVNGTEYEVSIYSILAGTQAGSAWITVVPNPGPLTAPGAPKNVTVTPGINSLVVAWEAPTITANNAATRYFVQWKTGIQSYSTSRQANAGVETGYTIPNLLADRQYRVRVGAENDAGGTWSGDVIGVPVSGPSVTIVTVNPTSISDSGSHDHQSGIYRSDCSFAISNPSEHWVLWFVNNDEHHWHIG